MPVGVQCPISSSLGEFPSLGLALVPDVVAPEVDSVRMEQKTLSKFLPCPGRTSDLGI